MKKKILLSLLVIVGLFTITGCGNKKDETNVSTSKEQSLIDIEKVYYQELDDEYLLYIFYNVKADSKKNITISGTSKLVSNNNNEYANSFFVNQHTTSEKEIIKNGYDSAITYKTLYAGSEKIEKYVGKFDISKNDFSQTLTLKVADNTDNNNYSIEKTFELKDFDKISFTSENEFVEKYNGNK